MYSCGIMCVFTENEYSSKHIFSTETKAEHSIGHRLKWKKKLITLPPYLNLRSICDLFFDNFQFLKNMYTFDVFESFYIILRRLFIKDLLHIIDTVTSIYRYYIFMTCFGSIFWGGREDFLKFYINKMRFIEQLGFQNWDCLVLKCK